MDFSEYTDTQLAKLFWQINRRVLTKKRLIKQYPEDKALKSSKVSMQELMVRILKEQARRSFND